MQSLSPLPARVSIRRAARLLPVLIAAAGPGFAPGAEPAAAAGPAGSYARYRLELLGASEDGRPLVVSLHSRDGAPSTGWALVGAESGLVAGHELRRDAGLLSGRLEVDVGSVGYRCRLAAAVIGEELTGTYTARRGVSGTVEGVTGSVGGRLHPPASGGDLRVELSLWSMYTPFGHIRSPGVRATVRGGVITAGTFAFGRKPENRGRLDGGALRVEGDRLRGEIRATVLAGDAAPGAYTFSIDAPVRSGFVEGTYSTVHHGDDWGEHGMTGEVHGVGKPGDRGVLVLALAGGIEGRRPLTLYLDRSGEVLRGGMARGGGGECHRVDASRLRCGEETLAGPLTVSLRPVGGFPPGGRSVECEYTIHAAIRGEEIVGGFAGSYGRLEPVVGALRGRVVEFAPPPPFGEPIGVLPERSYSPEEAARIGWPGLAGPYGTFLPVRTDIPIVDDLSRARIAWVSETADLGIGKQGTPFHKSFRSGLRVRDYLGPGSDRHPGSWSGVIAAGGRVFASSFRPTGPVFDCDFPDGVPAGVRVDAQDIVVAMDLRTGHTLWLAAEPGGMLTGGGKRAGFQVGPVHSRGRVFAMGSTGRLFAYEATSGRKLWQSDIGEAHQRAEEERRSVLAALARREFSYPRSPAWHTSLVVAGDTLVVPTFVRGGLRGLEAETGKPRWEAREVGSHLVTPSVWRHRGREYLLTANPAGEMRLLAPEDGQELWRVEGLGGSHFTLSPSPTHVLVNVNPASGKRPGGVRVPGFYGAYRITPEAAVRAWAMPFEPRNGFQCWMDSEARYRYTVRDGLAYLYTDGSGKEVPGRFLVVRQDSGRVVAEHRNDGDEADRIGGLWYLVGDRIITRWDASHGPRHGGRHPWRLWRISGSSITRLPGSLDRSEFTNGYEVNMEHPIVAGFLLERSEEGRVVCYDLRKRG